MEQEKSALVIRRLNSVRAGMKKAGTDIFIVNKAENKQYLTTFRPDDNTVIITPERNYLLTDFRYIEAAADHLSPEYEIIETRTGYGVFDFITDLLADGTGKSVGIEKETVSWSYAQELSRRIPKAEFVSFDGLVENIRRIKDDVELSYIREAEHIGDQAFSYILGEIRPGVSEREIALKLEMKMRELGAEGLSFPTIAVSGARTSLPHGEPTDKLIENGDLLTMDFGCRYNGYCSDMTRTVGVGHLDDEQKKIYEIVLRAQKTTCEAIHAGMTGREIDAVARDIITAEGYGDYFGHSLGHGVGLEIHEAPTASSRNEDIFRPNMLITIEPGIYLPKKFGVRIEDLSIVRDSDIIILSESEKELIIL